MCLQCCGYSCAPPHLAEDHTTFTSALYYQVPAHQREGAHSFQSGPLALYSAFLHLDLIRTFIFLRVGETPQEVRLWVIGEHSCSWVFRVLGLDLPLSDFHGSTLPSGLSSPQPPIPLVSNGRPFLDLSYFKTFTSMLYINGHFCLHACLGLQVHMHARVMHAFVQVHMCVYGGTYACVHIYMCVGEHMPVYRCMICTEVHVCVVCLREGVHLCTHEHTCMRLVPDAC